MPRSLLCTALVLASLLTVVHAAPPPDAPPKKPAKPTQRKKPKRDFRSTIPVAVRGLSAKTQAKVVTELEKIAGVDEALPDLAKREVVVKLGNKGALTYKTLIKALAAAKVAVDPRRLALKYPVTVTLGAPMRGATDKNKKGKRFRYSPAARVEEALKTVEGVKSIKWPTESQIKLGLDRPVPYRLLAEAVARRGSGAGKQIVDMSWLGEELTERQQQVCCKKFVMTDEMRRKRRAERKKKQQGSGGKQEGSDSKQQGSDSKNP